MVDSTPLNPSYHPIPMSIPWAPGEFVPYIQFQGPKAWDCSCRFHNSPWALYGDSWILGISFPGLMGLLGPVSFMASWGERGQTKTRNRSTKQLCDGWLGELMEGRRVEGGRRKEGKGGEDVSQGMDVDQLTITEHLMIQNEDSRERATQRPGNPRGKLSHPKSAVVARFCSTT